MAAQLPALMMLLLQPLLAPVFQCLTAKLACCLHLLMPLAALQTGLLYAGFWTVVSARAAQLPVPVVLQPLLAPVSHQLAARLACYSRLQTM